MKHRFKKALGQHFLTDQQQLHTICQYIQPRSDDTFIEIGAGNGVLSAQIAKNCRKLMLIEIDNTCIPVLKKKFGAYSHVHIIHADALRTDFATLFANSCRIIGNLPYNISSQLILKLLTISGIQDISIVIQKELADRLCAETNSADYGRFTLMVAIQAQPYCLHDIPAQAFYPVPQVCSTLVRLVPKDCPLTAQQLQTYAKLVQTAFSQRRKQVINSLKAYLDSGQLMQLGIAPAQRAENLTCDDFIRMAKSIHIQP